MPDEEISKPVAQALKFDFFDWNDGYFPWRGDPEREQLFVFLLIQVHRFVVLHETAHILHNHGGGGPDYGLGTVVDGSAPLNPDEATAADKMARELVADSQAFHLHFKLLDREFARAEDEMSKLLKEKLVTLSRDRLGITLFSAYLVFQILDHREWSMETARLRSHPPAPFRMKALYATAVDLKHKDLPQDVISDEIAHADLMGAMVVDIALNRLPQLGWTKQVEGPEFDAMFAHIYENMSKWADPALLRSG